MWTWIIIGIIVWLIVFALVWDACWVGGESRWHK